MSSYLGDFDEDATVYLMFNTFTSDDPSASCTITNLTNTDVHIHKDDSLTDRCNAAGITVSIDFDGVTGSHMIKIDTSDDTVAGFWQTGHDYFVRIEGTTIDGATINAVVAHFSIENRYMRGTNSAALASVCTEARMAHLDADVSSRNAVTPPTVEEIRQEMDTNSTKMAPSQNLDDYKADVSSLALEATLASIKGAGFVEATDSLEAIRDRGDAAWVTATGFATENPPSQNLDDYKADVSSLALEATLASIKGAGFVEATDSLEAIRDRGDAAWVTGGGGAAPTAEEIREEIEGAGHMLAAVKSDIETHDINIKAILFSEY